MNLSITSIVDFLVNNPTNLVRNEKKQKFTFVPMAVSKKKKPKTMKELSKGFEKLMKEKGLDPKKKVDFDSTIKKVVKQQGKKSKK